MKKALFALGLMLSMSVMAIANPNGGGLFQRGADDAETSTGWRLNNNEPALPMHGEITNQDATTHVGSGIAILTVLGTAYLLGRKTKRMNNQRTKDFAL